MASICLGLKVLKNLHMVSKNKRRIINSLMLKAEKIIPNFVDSPYPADMLALLDAKTLADAVVAKVWSSYMYGTWH